MMIDWVSSRLRGDAAAQSIQAVRLACAAGPGAADSGLAGAGRGYAPSGEFGSARCLAGRARMATMGLGSGGGERVVAELGQDVAGLADDLAASDSAARLPLQRSLTVA